MKISIVNEKIFKNSLIKCSCLLIFLLFSFITTPSWAAIPNTPSGLTATALSSTQIKLDWTDNSTDETRFYIERKTGEAGTGNYGDL